MKKILLFLLIFLIIPITNALPDLEIISPKNITSNSNSNGFVIMSFIANSNNATWIGFSLDGSLNITLENITNNLWIKNEELASGTHKVKFYANNSLGNINESENIYFTINLYQPNDYEKNLWQVNPIIYFIIFLIFVFFCYIIFTSIKGLLK